MGGNIDFGVTHIQKGEGEITQGLSTALEP